MYRPGSLHQSITSSVLLLKYSFILLFVSTILEFPRIVYFNASTYPLVCEQINFRKLQVAFQLLNESFLICLLDVSIPRCPFSMKDEWSEKRRCPARRDGIASMPSSLVSAAPPPLLTRPDFGGSQGFTAMS